MPESTPRIASLLPSATEIVCFLGLESHLVARSHECDFPPRIVKKIPICTAPSVNTSQSSGEINLDVHRHLEKSLSMFTIDWALLRQLKPDYIIAQSHCRVCAVHKDDLEKDVREKLGHAVRIIDSSPQKLSDVWADIGKIGHLFGVSEVARQKVEKLTDQVRRIYDGTKHLPDKPTVVAIEWIEPLMSAGNWVPELIELAGGTNFFGKVGEHSDWLTWEQIRAKNPNILIVLPCGFDIDRARAAMGPITTRQGWYDLEAVQNNRVFLLDGNQYFNRPGPRLLESLEILAEIFHPDVFDFGHKLEGWEYWGFDRVE